MVDLCLLKCLRSMSQTLLAFMERGPTFQIKISKAGCWREEGSVEEELVETGYLVTVGAVET